MHYYTSTGERISPSEKERSIRAAKQKKIEQMLDTYGYLFCQDCKRNDCLPLDCSHEISVKEAQESGRVELAWDVNNIKIRGRRCHLKHDHKSKMK